MTRFYTKLPMRSGQFWSWMMVNAAHWRLPKMDVDQQQLAERFIMCCHQQLKASGWLVLNCWTEHQQETAFLAALSEHFVDVRVVLTGSRNWVILAGKVADEQSATALKAKALRLSTDMGFALTPHLGRMKVWGAAVGE